MNRRLMRARCPGARALGIATLAGWRFVISSEGFASIAPRAGSLVRGVVWRLTLRDLAAVNAYEGVDCGLYRRRKLAVRLGERQALALVYIAPQRRVGTPRPGYIDLVLEAAHDWGLPRPYIRSLARWSPSRWRGARAVDAGDVR